MQTGMAMPSLRSRILRAGSWTLFGHMAAQILRLASNLIMTRLLMPDMFGIMAIANVVMVGVALFSDIGLNQGIIQSKRGNDPIYLNTAWTVQILRGFLIFLVILAIAAGLNVMGDMAWLPADSAYADPLLPSVMAMVAVTAVINGFLSTRLATANRNLALGRVTMIELVSQVAAIVLMVAWALLDRSIWALVAGMLFGALVKVSLSHTYLPGEKNRLFWDKQAFSEIFGFGKWIFLTSILGFLALNGDRLILGSLIDAETLGLYAVAFLLIEALQQLFNKFSANVAFPALSEVVRSRPSELKRSYYNFQIPIDIAVFGVVGLLFCLGPLFVGLLYDDRYHISGEFLKILSVSLILVRYELMNKLFLALGMPRLIIPIISVRILVIFVFVPLGYYKFGVDGSLWAVVISAISPLPIMLYLKLKYKLIDFGREFLGFPFLFVGYLLGTILQFFVSVFCD